MIAKRIPRNATWTEVYPGFVAYKRSNGSRSFVRHVASGETHMTPHAFTHSDDAVMMAIYYAQKGETAKAREQIIGYLHYCFGSARVIQIPLTAGSI